MEEFKSRGERWFHLLTEKGNCVDSGANSVKVADREGIRYIAVVPDPRNQYPRARHGEVGLIEGWTLATLVNRTIKEDEGCTNKRPIVAIVDVTSQAYGRREEAFGIHQALAGAAGAYAKARLMGHPIVALIVGKAMSGAFLAHGYQANCLLAFDDPAVLIHAMGKASAARITLRTIEALDHFAATVPPMAYDVKHYATLGLLEKLLKIEKPDQPTNQDVLKVREAIDLAIKKAQNSDRTLQCRLGADNRQASRLVREQMKAVW